MDNKKFDHNLPQKEKDLIFGGHEYNLEKMQASWIANLDDLRTKAFSLRYDKIEEDSKTQEEYKHKHIRLADGILSSIMTMLGKTSDRYKRK